MRRNKRAVLKRIEINVPLYIEVVAELRRAQTLQGRGYVRDSWREFRSRQFVR